MKETAFLQYLILVFDGSSRAPQAPSPLPDREGKEEAGSFLNHKENRVKPKISTMVFLGEEIHPPGSRSGG